jgi:lysozyme family protein
MIRNFEKSLSLVLKHEGGYVNHPNDPGGPTNKGVTLATMRRYVDRSATVDDLKRISDAQVATIYRRQYWNAVKGDELPDGVDYAVFDFAVNSGPARAIKTLQLTVDARTDGKIGPLTLAAVANADSATVIRGLCNNRFTFLRALKTWSTFGKGWSRRVNEVEAHALAMAKQPPKPSQKPVSDRQAPEPPSQGHWLSRLLAGLAGALARIFNPKGK